MYKLHIANKNYSSWSLRPWILLTELGIPFEEVLSVFESEDNWHSFRNFSPTGKVPCLQDGEITVWDSLAIIEYIAEQHDNVWPTDKHARTWARCASAEMHSGFQELRNICPMNCGVMVELKSIPEALNKDIQRINELWQQGFNEFNGPYLAGEQFSAVDAFYAPVVFRIRSFGLPMSERVLDYVRRMFELESMQSWYQAALQEPWLEISHEKEIECVGRVIQDSRLIAKQK